MAEPKTTLWPLAQHTVGKHLLLKGYLDAWLPILGSRFGRIVFVDGFAGPGEYTDGEPGSPIVALNTLLKHDHVRRIKAEIVFYFIERKEDRAAHLRGLVDAVRPTLPENAKVSVEVGRFDAKMGSVLSDLEREGQRLAPAFVMIDPFGVSGTPMSVIERILQNPSCEVFVSFMYESINRFAATPEFAPNLDDLFGTDAWRDGLSIADEELRSHFYHDLYAKQLKIAGAKHVLNFGLYKGSKRLVYSIFFGTQNLLGCSKMKDAMWKIAPDGDFAFRGGEFGQLALGIEPAGAQFGDELRSEFAGAGPVSIDRIEEFAQSDKTLFRVGHLRQKTLTPMEKSGQITVTRPPGKKKGFPEGTLIEFA